jgi:hypothetical protein
MKDLKIPGRDKSPDLNLHRSHHVNVKVEKHEGNELSLQINSPYTTCRPEPPRLPDPPPPPGRV